MLQDILFEKIQAYNTIIIHRHSRPDGDALGSQIGLAEALKTKYPNKKIYCVGDSSRKYGFIGYMDLIEDKEYQGALAIILDVAVANMVSDERYRLASEVFVIDHHKNDCDITPNFIQDTTRIAAAELIASMLYERGFEINKKCATALYLGIVTDSGRFLYGFSKNTFDIAGRLSESGADAKFVYDNLYVESKEEREMKNYFQNKINYIGKVAYMKNDYSVFEKFNVEFQDISRGMVNLMAGISDVEIWCNFTYDKEKDKVVCEFRSRSIPIVDVAKKWGGGGHSLACGCTINDFNEADLVLNDFLELIKITEN